MKDLDASKLLRVLEWRKKNRPVPWIAREENLTLAEVKTVLRLAGDTVLGREISAERWDEINYWVIQDASLVTIMRETGAYHGTLKRYFPNAGWEVGGSGKAAKTRQMYQDLTRIDDSGKMAKRRQRT